MNDPMYPATISDFELDVYEITVGRFRAFVEAGQGTQQNPPAPRAGAHPAIAESGWNPNWNSELAPNSEALKTLIGCPGYSFWTVSADQNEHYPMTCITWYDAFAFCIWDGGRLPTEAEWNYAAAAGAEQREYPWGSTIDESRAAYDCKGDDDASCSRLDILFVGSKSPAGHAKWGHADMAGNIQEWVLDIATSQQNPCNDCARIHGGATNRIVRGGTAWSRPFAVTTWSQSQENPANRTGFAGARCARGR